MNLVIAWAAMAQVDRPNFAGSYKLTAIKGGIRQQQAASWTLRVAQTESIVEVTKAMDGFEISYRCPVDGEPAKFSTPDGGIGTCRARWKEKTLELEKLISRRPKPKAAEVQTQIWERWKLSSDSKTLTIRVDVNFPGTPISGAQLIGPSTEIYARN
jgi:hypothetical protein